MERNKSKPIVAAILFVFLLAMSFSIHPAGKPSETKMDDFFIAHGQEETGSNNIVAAIVFDYRGMDTLVEASVLFAAATGVFIALGGGKK